MSSDRASVYADQDGDVQQHVDAEYEDGGFSNDDDDEDDDDGHDEDDTFSDSDPDISPTKPLLIPQAIQDAERTSASPKPYEAKDHPVHPRYTCFLRTLCNETSTASAEMHTIEGLPYAIWTADSLALEENYEANKILDTYAFALIIHVWQLACWRLQYGSYPDTDPEVSLSSKWGSYTITAHLLVCQQRTVLRAHLNMAVLYWETRLRLRGRGGGWLETRWAKDIQQNDQTISIHRNDLANRYLEMLDEHETLGLAYMVVDEEAKGYHTHLRDMAQASPESKKEATKQLSIMLTSMDTHLLKAIIEGQVFKKFHTSEDVFEAIRKLAKVEHIQPSTYMNSICDRLGSSPSPAQ